MHHSARRRQRPIPTRSPKKSPAEGDSSPLHGRPPSSLHGLQREKRGTAQKAAQPGPLQPHHCAALNIASWVSPGGLQSEASQQPAALHPHAALGPRRQSHHSAVFLSLSTPSSEAGMQEVSQPAADPHRHAAAVRHDPPIPAAAAALWGRPVRRPFRADEEGQRRCSSQPHAASPRS